MGSSIGVGIGVGIGVEVVVPPFLKASTG